MAVSWTLWRSVKSRVREQRWTRGLVAVLLLLPTLALSVTSAASAATTARSPVTTHGTVVPKPAVPRPGTRSEGVEPAAGKASAKKVHWVGPRKVGVWTGPRKIVRHKAVPGATREPIPSR